MVPSPMPKRLYFLHSGFMMSVAARLLQESALTREHDGRSGSYNLLFRSRITSENSEIGPPRLMLRWLQPRSLSKIWPSEVLKASDAMVQTGWGCVKRTRSRIFQKCPQRWRERRTHLQSCSRPPSASRRAHSVGDLGIVAIFPLSLSPSSKVSVWNCINHLGSI